MFFSFRRYLKELKDVLFVRFIHKQSIVSRKMIIFANKKGRIMNRQPQGYYAERMCLTERYLTTVIRQTSGTTAKDWIDRALITRIKIELRHTDKSSAQIAEEMHFANPSFFSKYFRRLTGMTPGEYKNYS